jgi:hypothetical protein
MLAGLFAHCVMGRKGLRSRGDPSDERGPNPEPSGGLAKIITRRARGFDGEDESSWYERSPSIGKCSGGRRIRGRIHHDPYSTVR